MKKETSILKIMNIRPEEAKAVFMLMAFSFFTGLTLSFYFTASNALFLKHFDPSMIPVSFIASGVLIYLAWLVFSKIDRKLSFHKQVTTKLLFVFITVLIISAGVYWLNNSWLIFITYTWVRIVVYITLVTFWGIAGKLFNIRQGKRIFGLIGIGEVISIMIGYFSIPFILKFLKATDLLFLSSGTLLLCYLMAVLIISTFKSQLIDLKKTKIAAVVKDENKTSYWKLIKKPYFRYISMMALLPIFGYLFVDFLFLSQTKVEFAKNPEAIAGFFGVFLGFVAVIELFLKLISGRFLNKYGIRPSLLSLPVILISTISIAAFFGAIYGTIGLFFAFIALSRLFERSVRSAAYEPSFQLLYQPLPAEQRLVFQNQIEGIPKALGTVITGAVILLFSSIASVNLVFHTWFFILVLAFWIWTSLKMYESYRRVLRNKLDELKSETNHVHQPFSEMIYNELMKATIADFDHIFKRSDAVDPLLTDKMLIKVFKDVPEDIQKCILNLFIERNILKAVPFLSEMRIDDFSHDLQISIQNTIEELASAEKSSIDELETNSRSENPKLRLDTARLLGSSGRYNTIRLLQKLAKDPNPEVKKAAIIACGKIKRYELWPFITEQLADPEFSAAAAIAIEQIGEPILPELEKLFEKSNNKIWLQMQILGIYEHIESQKAIKLLRDKMVIPNKDLRRRVFSALSAKKYQATASEVPVMKGFIEDSVAYILWILATLNDLEKMEDALELKMALLTEMDDHKEQVFMLLSLMYDAKTIHHIREHIESKDANAKVYALEIGDMMISSDIKEIFFPVFEDLPFQERLNRFMFRFPQQKMEAVDRLIDVLNQEYTYKSRYTKACVLRLMADQQLKDNPEIESALLANILHPDPLLSESAAWSLSERDKEIFSDRLKLLSKNGSRDSQLIVASVSQRLEKKELLLFEKIEFMKNTDLFSTLPESVIADILSQFPCIQFHKKGVKNEMKDEVNQSDIILARDGTQILFPAGILYERILHTDELSEKLFSFNTHN